mgnify:CR=1 FL=1
MIETLRNFELTFSYLPASWAANIAWRSPAPSYAFCQIRSSIPIDASHPSYAEKMESATVLKIKRAAWRLAVTQPASVSP